jgi:pimeloyl-ACP methyl ester carboxylesterase
MATYVLIHGAGDSGWYWHLVEAELRGRGHDVVAPDLPSEDDSAGLPEYTDAVVETVGDRTGLVVVAQSFGGFTAPLVCDRLPVDLLVLLAGMVPLPGEPPGDWWANTGYEQAKGEQDERGGGGATSPARRWRRLAPAGVAGRADKVPALPRRPLLPRPVPAPGGPRGADGCRHPAPPSSGRSPPGGTRPQLHPLVVPQDSQTKQEPAGRMRTPQVEQ